MRRNKSSQLSLGSSCSSGGGDEHLCRVCRCGEECGPLFYPCKCKGSIRYVHEDCLVEWLRVSKKVSCELCLTEFQFQSVYQDDTPNRLSLLEVLYGAVQLGFSAVPQVIRYIIVGLIWFTIFPLYTSRVNGILFCTSREDVGSLLTKWDFNTLAWDCFSGLILAACIVAAFLALMVLQDYVRRNEWQDENHHLNVQNLRRGLDRNIVDIADRVVEAAVAAAADANELVEEIQAAGENNRLMALGNMWLGHQENENHINDDQLIVNEEIGDEEKVNEDPCEQEIVEPLGPIEEEHPQQDQPAEDLIDIDDIVIEDDEPGLRGGEEELAWEVLVGLRGGFSRGLYTMTLVSLANTAFLLLFQFLPFSVGRLILSAFSEDTHSSSFVLCTGYGLFIGSVLFYLLQKKVVELWKGRSRAASAPDIVARYAMPLWVALLDMLTMGVIIVLELFVLGGLVGLLAHVGIMGVSGDFFPVFKARMSLCGTSPLTCAAIHWAVGSVVVANWSALIWAFRQVVHPYFRVPTFEGWYDGSKKLRNSLFGPLLARQEQQAQEQTTRWKERIELVTSRIIEEKNKFGSDELMEENQLKKLCVDQAPVADSEVEAMPQPSIISSTLEESLSYVVTVILWSIPAVLAFLVIPIQFTKVFVPWVFPLRIGLFREPFAGAQLPLDVFLFHTLPFAIERLNLNKVFLDAARLVADVLTRPLDLHGYVLKLRIPGLQSGFVHVESRHPLNNSRAPQIPSKVMRNLSVRKVKIPLSEAPSSFKVLSSVKPGERVDILGVVSSVPSMVDLGPKLRNPGLWLDEPVHVFSVADSMGYCMPVFVRFKEEFPLADLSTDLEFEMRSAILRFCDILESRTEDIEGLERASIIRARLDSSFSSGGEERKDTSEAKRSSLVISMARGVREEVQDRPDLVDLFVDLLPEGFGSNWQGGHAVRVLRGINQIAMLWRDCNHPPVLAVKGGIVDSLHGRTLILDEVSLLLLEPDCGGKAELARICFDVRRVENPNGGQFCVLRHEPQYLGTRLRFLAFFATVAAVVSSTTSIVLPLLCGRYFFALANDPLKHDLYHWGGGVFVLWLFGYMTKWFWATVAAKDGGWKRALNLCVVWSISAVQWAMAIFLFGVVVPLLTGILFELVIVDPIRVSTDVVPVILVIQDWALGLALLKAWSRLCLLGIVGGEKWIDKLEKIQYDGAYGINLLCTIREIAIPLLSVILLRLCVPYAFVMSLTHLFSLETETTEWYMRYSFPLFSGLLFIRNLVMFFFAWLDMLHDKVRDNRYMIGRQLQNR